MNDKITIDAKAHTLKEIERQRKVYSSELDQFAKTVKACGVAS